MQDHATGLDLLLERDESRIGRIVPEPVIDLSVEENVTGRQRLGRPMCFSVTVRAIDSSPLRLPGGFERPFGSRLVAIKEANRCARDKAVR